MKLIIDIPEEEYNNIEPFLNGETIKGGFNLFKALEIIKNGTPLDDVKAEIKKNILDEPVENGTNAEMACYNGGLFKCLEIIDKHIGKAESEDEK